MDETQYIFCGNFGAEIYSKTEYCDACGANTSNNTFTHSVRSVTSSESSTTQHKNNLQENQGKTLLVISLISVGLMIISGIGFLFFYPLLSILIASPLLLLTIICSFIARKKFPKENIKYKISSGIVIGCLILLLIPIGFGIVFLIGLIALRIGEGGIILSIGVIA